MAETSFSCLASEPSVGRNLASPLRQHGGIAADSYSRERPGREAIVSPPLAAAKYNRKRPNEIGPSLDLVRKGGFEPPRSCERQPLKLVRLPVPPLPQY